MPDDFTATKEINMQHALRIAFRNMDVSDALEQRIRKRVAELELLCDRITSCDVVVEMHHRHPRQGKMFHIRVDIVVPGRTIVVRREPTDNHAHEDAHLAVRDAFDAARRQLEDHVRVARGDVKTHTRATQAD
jgi:ribosomal subunit interface protein